MNYFELIDNYNNTMLKAKEKDGSVSALTFLDPKDKHYDGIVKEMFENCGITKLTVVDINKFEEIISQGLEACKQIYGNDFDYRVTYKMQMDEKT